VGVAVSVPKTLEAAGVKNIPDWFNPSVGVLVLLNLDPEPEVSLGVFATFINIPF